MEILFLKENKLMQAIGSSDWAEVRRICETEPHLINTKDEFGETPLIHAAVRRQAPEDILLLLIDRATTENIEHEYGGGFTVLHLFAWFAYASALGRALERTRTHINLRNRTGRTPLHYCLSAAHRSYDAHQDMALCLMTYGASVSIKDNIGKTPLDLYEDNKCWEYEETTRNETKKQLKDLLEELSVPAEILARGENAIMAFKSEIQDGEITVVNSRLMLMGKEGVGKTSCVNAILGRRFNQNERSTDGIVTTTVFQCIGEDYNTWEEQKDVDVCELTRQMHEQAIAANIAKKLTKIQQNASKSGESNPGGTSSSDFLGSSMDELPEEVVSTTLQNGDKRKSRVGLFQRMRRNANRFEKKLPERIHKKLVDTLAEQIPGPRNVGPSDVICIWDYAGQLTYYITHRFFITDGSSYGIVFSLLDNMDAKARPRDSQKGPCEMTNLQMIIFWIRSIYEHAVLPHSEERRIINGTISSPPISLIGTHKDKLPGNEGDKQKSIEDQFNRIFTAIKGTPYERNVDREMYAVDNTSTSDVMIDKLKTNVGGYMKAMTKTVPTKWANFQAKVQEVGKTTVRMYLDEITNIAVECGISRDKFNHVLNYLNDLGIILYSPTNRKLKNTVITNIHMLIGIFTKIITAVKPDDVDKVPVMIEHWRKLDEEGILAEQLVRYLWRNELAVNKNEDDVLVEFIEIMKTFGLLFEMGSQEGKRLFVVPSRMKTKTESLEVKKDEERTVSIYVTHEFLPDAVYDVLVVKFLNLSQDKGCRFDKQLFQNQAEIGFDDKHYLRLGRLSIDNKQSLKLEISRRPQIDQHGVITACKPHPSACMEVLHVLKQHLNEMYPSKGGVSYALQILCLICSTPGKPHFQELEKCLTNELMTCDKTSEKLAMSTTPIQNLFVAASQDTSTEGEGPLVSAPSMTSIGISDKEFQAMLIQVSNWYDSCGYTNKLKVLYKDKVDCESDLESCRITLDLFKLLEVAGLLTPTDFKVLIDTIKVTNSRGVVNVNELLLDANDETKITSFTIHRQKVIKLGNVLTAEDTYNLGKLYGVSQSEYKDQWTLILYLEKMEVIHENKMWPFIEDLKSISLHHAALKLEEEE